MWSNVVIFLVTIVFMFMGTVQSAPKERTSYFEGDEHELIGDRINFPREPGISTTLTLTNGLQLQFGQIIALAGDFFGVPNQPIIIPQSSNQAAQRTRFMEAYGTLAFKPRSDIEAEVTKLLKMIKEDGLVRKYHNGTFHTDIEYILASNGNMLILAQTDYDHFEPQAPKAYRVGHQLAIETAREAAKETDPQKKKMKLMKAFSIDAFASHFLTDSFSSGHIRTTRVALHNQVTPSSVGDYLSKFMHDEDCKYGLRVKNRRGDKWIAYGDGFLLKNGSKVDLRLAIEAVQKSIDQVDEAYKHPDRRINLDSVTDLIPFVDPNAKNNAPLFQIRGSNLLRRKNVSDLQDTNTKSNWWGTTTVVLLLGATKKNSALPPA